MKEEMMCELTEQELRETNGGFSKADARKWALGTSRGAIVMIYGACAAGAFNPAVLAIGILGSQLWCLCDYLSSNSGSGERGANTNMEAAY